MIDQWINEFFKSKKQKRYEARIARIEAIRLTKQQQQIEQTRQRQLQQQIEKTRIIKAKIETFVCKRCFVKFFNNIKLHEHVRTKHAKKFSVITSLTSSASLFFISMTSHVTTSATFKISIS